MTYPRNVADYLKYPPAAAVKPFTPDELKNCRRSATESWEDVFENVDSLATDSFHWYMTGTEHPYYYDPPEHLDRLLTICRRLDLPSEEGARAAFMAADVGYRYFYFLDGGVFFRDTEMVGDEPHGGFVIGIDAFSFLCHALGLTQPEGYPRESELEEEEEDEDEDDDEDDDEDEGEAPSFDKLCSRILLQRSGDLDVPYNDPRLPWDLIES